MRPVNRCPQCNSRRCCYDDDRDEDGEVISAWWTCADCGNRWSHIPKDRIVKKIKTTPVVQGDGEKFRYFPISTKHPCYAAGRQAYCLGLSINQCPARTRDGFDDGRFHWLAGWIQARVADRLWKLLPPGWDAVNRMSGKIDCGSDS